MHRMSEMCLAPQKDTKPINGEGYNTVEELLEAAREEYAVSQLIEEATALCGELEEFKMAA